MVRQSTISPALPMFATPFIGRTVEIAEIVTSLQNSTTRLMTLTGPGGIGKTRLSLKTAQQFLEQAESAENILFPDGIFFIALARLSSIEHIITAIAESFEYQFLPQVDAKQQP